MHIRYSSVVRLISSYPLVKILVECIVYGDLYPTPAFFFLITHLKLSFLLVVQLHNADLLLDLTVYVLWYRKHLRREANSMASEFTFLDALSVSSFVSTMR